MPLTRSYIMKPFRIIRIGIFSRRFFFFAFDGYQTDNIAPGTRKSPCKPPCGGDVR